MQTPQNFPYGVGDAVWVLEKYYHTWRMGLTTIAEIQFKIQGCFVKCIGYPRSELENIFTNYTDAANEIIKRHKESIQTERGEI